MQHTLSTTTTQALIEQAATERGLSVEAMLTQAFLDGVAPAACTGCTKQIQDLELDAQGLDCELDAQGLDCECGATGTVSSVFALAGMS